MIGPRRLVTFVEGRGDEAAVPAVTRRLLGEAGGTDVLYVDPAALRVDGLGSLVKDDCHKWRRLLEAAGRRTRPAVAAALLVLDGEADPVPRTWQAYVGRYHTTAFCAHRVAAELAEAGRSVRAGEAFSLAVTLAVPEFEAWLLGGIEGLRGVPLPDSSRTVGQGVNVDGLDVEGRRDAKQLLADRIPGYSPSMHQGVLATHLSIADAARRSRSFRRLRSAVAQLVTAARDGRAIATSLRPIT